MDVAAKFATQWTLFLVILKTNNKSDVASKFQPNMTSWSKDITFCVKTAIFCEKICDTLFLNMLLQYL